MRTFVVLALILIVVLMLTEIGEAKKRREPQVDTVGPNSETGANPEEGGHRRGNKHHGKEKKGKRNRGHHNEESEDEMTHTEGTVDVTAAPDAAQQVSPQETQQEGASSLRKDKKTHGGADKAARRAAKQERLQNRHEKQAEKEARKEGRSERKQARKEAKRQDKQTDKDERKQQRKEHKRMERNLTSDCDQHSDCSPGSCCQQRGEVKKCRSFSKDEGSMCFNDCVCAQGLECYVREQKKAKHPDSSPKGRCRSISQGEEETQVPVNENGNEDE